MSERVFADDFRKGFFKEDDFLEFLDRREENAGVNANIYLSHISGK